MTPSPRGLDDLLADARRNGETGIRGGLRGIDLQIGPGLLGRRPRFTRLTLDGVAGKSIAARNAIFDGVSMRGVCLDGPFEAFEGCAFSDCTTERLSLQHVLFEGCTFTDCELDLRPRDGVAFIDCTFDRVVLKGDGEFSLARSSFRAVDATALMFDGIIEAQGEADLALPATVSKHGSVINRAYVLGQPPSRGATQGLTCPRRARPRPPGDGDPYPTRASMVQHR